MGFEFVKVVLQYLIKSRGDCFRQTARGHITRHLKQHGGLGLGRLSDHRRVCYDRVLFGALGSLRRSCEPDLVLVIETNLGKQRRIPKVHRKIERVCQSLCKSFERLVVFFALTHTHELRCATVVRRRWNSLFLLNDASLNAVKDRSCCFLG